MICIAWVTFVSFWVYFQTISNTDFSNISSDVNVYPLWHTKFLRHDNNPSVLHKNNEAMPKKLFRSN